MSKTAIVVLSARTLVIKSALFKPRHKYEIRGDLVSGLKFIDTGVSDGIASRGYVTVQQDKMATYPQVGMSASYTGRKVRGKKTRAGVTEIDIDSNGNITLQAIPLSGLSQANVNKKAASSRYVGPNPGQGELDGVRTRRASKGTRTVKRNVTAVSAKRLAILERYEALRSEAADVGVTLPAPSVDIKF